MCWSTYEREEFERFEREREALLRTVSAPEPQVEPDATDEEVDEREGELVRV
jgi:hypothetical protein